MGPLTARPCTRSPAARSASATCAPAPTDPRPTARQSASSAPCSAAGPTAPSTAPAPNARQPLTAGSGTTTITDDTQPSATSPQSLASTSEPTCSGLTPRTALSARSWLPRWRLDDRVPDLAQPRQQSRPLMGLEDGVVAAASAARDGLEADVDVVGVVGHRQCRPPDVEQRDHLIRGEHTLELGDPPDRLIDDPVRFLVAHHRDAVDPGNVDRVA